MPSGAYSFHDPTDGTPLGGERFSCAPGPAGWRYTAASADGRRSVDLTLDVRGRPVRMEVVAGDWRVRGGATVLDGAAAVAWVRAPADPAHAAPAAQAAQSAEGDAKTPAFTGSSPAFLVATARLLGLAPGQSVRVRLTALTDPVLAPHPREEAWALTGIEEHPTPGGPLPVARYEVADLATGVRGVVHLAGDVVLAAPGVELEELHSPPNFI